MTRYYYAQTFGYGMKIMKYPSDPGYHEVECSLGGFLWKSPIFFIAEYEEMPGGFSWHLKKKQEFFTGINLNPTCHETCGSRGLFIVPSDGAREVSAVEFERLIGAIREKKRKKIAVQIRQYNKQAIELFDSRKVAAERKQLAETNAAQRLKQTKHY